MVTQSSFVASSLGLVVSGIKVLIVKWLEVGSGFGLSEWVSGVFG